MNDEGARRAVDGLLRELARGGELGDDAFVRRLLEKTRPRRRFGTLRLVAASLLLAAAGLVFAMPWAGRATVEVLSGAAVSENGRWVTPPGETAELLLADDSRIVGIVWLQGEA